MKRVVCLAVFLAFAFVPVASLGAEEEVHEYFLCTFKPGKGMKDLMAVVEEWKGVIGGVEGSAGYEAWVLTPVVSGNMNQVAWLGKLPTLTAMGSLADNYGKSAVGQSMDVKFGQVVSCESHEFWSATRVR
jgi:hypothetical protein